MLLRTIEPVQAHDAVQAQRLWMKFTRFVGVLLFVSACSSTPKQNNLGLAEVRADFQPSFFALADALRDHQDEQARRILQRIFALNPDRATLDAAEAYDRVLVGRELLSCLNARLEVQPIERPAEPRNGSLGKSSDSQDNRSQGSDGPADGAIILTLAIDVPSSWPVQPPHSAESSPDSRNKGSRWGRKKYKANKLLDYSSEPVVLRTGGGSLRLHGTALALDGTERRQIRSQPMENLRELHLFPGQTWRRELGRFPMELGAALAARLHFRLRLVAGELDWARENMPAAGLDIQAAEYVQTAAYLPRNTAPVEALLRYARRPRIFLPALLERTVRIAPADRQLALDQLSKVAVNLDRIRLEEVIPALRWLSGESRLAGDVEGWQAWLEHRTRSPQSASAPPDLNESPLASQTALLQRDGSTTGGTQPPPQLGDRAERPGTPAPVLDLPIGN